jgi:mRNA interferase HigB
MRIIAVGTLRDFWSQPAYRDAEQPLRTWVSVTRPAHWDNPPVVKAIFNSAGILQAGRVIFDIGGNKYRLVAQINYAKQIVYVRFVGTHAQYDKINPQTI